MPRCFGRFQVETLEKRNLGGVFKSFLFVTPKIGEMIQFDLRIFFRWVGEKPPPRNAQSLNVTLAILRVFRWPFWDF